MIKISKSQKEHLIKQGILKMEKGRYPDLSICNKEHGKGMSKTYYVPSYMGRYLKNIL